MDQGGDPPAGPGAGEWAAAHPSLSGLARALGISPPDRNGLRAALVEWETVEIWEHTELVERQPGLVVAALIEADRTGSADLLGGILGFLGAVAGSAPVVSELAAHDEALALRCIPRVLDPEASLASVGALTTLRVLAAERAHPSAYADVRWTDPGSLWSWPPERLWELLLVADERLPRPGRDLGSLYAVLFEAAPEQVFRADPQSADDAEAEALVHAHVRAFVEQAAAVAAAGSDAAAWSSWIGRHMSGCGDLSCCRFSRFEAELVRWGFWIRVGRTPWT